MLVAGREVNSRIFMGSARFPSLQVFEESLQASQCDVVTVSLRRAKVDSSESQNFWHTLKKMNVHILPNTAGCHSKKEAVTTAQMAREFFETDWIKLEVIGNDDTLQPDPFALVDAAKELNKLGFKVFPYMTEDLIVAEKLLDAGCEILMPWASPIGSGRGLMNPYLLKTLRSRYPNVFMVVDAGIGKPSHATLAMELGFDAVLLNTAISQANNPVKMASAFAKAVEAGRLGYEAGLMEKRNMAVPSTPVVGTPFWHHEQSKGLL